MKNKIIKIQDEVIIDNIILEKGDKIQIIEGFQNFRTKVTTKEGEQLDAGIVNVDSPQKLNDHALFTVWINKPQRSIIGDDYDVKELGKQIIMNFMRENEDMEKDIDYILSNQKFWEIEYRNHLIRVSGMYQYTSTFLTKMGI